MTDQERILEFDRELIRADDYRVLIPKVMYWIMGSLGCLTMMFPITGKKEEGIFFIFPFMFLGMAVIFRMQLYIYINNTVRIESVLAYMPVDKMVFRRVRRGYLRIYLAKLGVAVFVFQQIGASMEKCWSVWNLFYPAAVITLLYLTGLAYIRVISIREMTTREGLAVIAGIAALFLGFVFLCPYSFDTDPVPNRDGIVNLYAFGPMEADQRLQITHSAMALDVKVDSDEYKKVVEILDKYSYHRGIRSIFNRTSGNTLFQKKNEHNHNGGWCDMDLSFNHLIRIGCDGGVRVGEKMYVLYGGKKKAEQLIGELLELMRECADTEYRGNAKNDL